MDEATWSEDRGPQELCLSDFHYDLPPQLIAQVPAAERDGARLLVLDRERAEVGHAAVCNLPQLVCSGDVLVLNDTRVRPSRLFGCTPNGGAVELLLVCEAGAGFWQCLGKPAKRLRPGVRLTFASGATAEVRDVRGAGWYVIRFSPSVDVPQLLSQDGEIPLPPYIKRPDGLLPLDRERYQTIFAAREGAVAAPTAGLHFTHELLAALTERGIELAWLTLEVGPATFLPVRSENVREHRMRAEWATIPAATVEAIRRAKSEGRRVIAVGTTTTRALESAAAQGGLTAGASWADAFILPGFRFRIVDAMFTNFHLPGSTLLMLVSAFAGRELILDAYAIATRKQYRFYSYGDAMLIC